jgi:hypothetical protein
MKKWLMIISIPTLIVATLVLIVLDVQSVENPERKRKAVAISLAVREQYPDLRCYWSPRRGYVEMYVCGTTDPERQLEVKEWIISFKAKNGIDLRIWLGFYEQDDSSHNGPQGRVIAMFGEI